MGKAVKRHRTNNILPFPAKEPVQSDNAAFLKLLSEYTTLNDKTLNAIQQTINALQEIMNNAEAEKSKLLSQMLETRPQPQQRTPPAT